MTRLPDYRLNPPDVDAPQYADWATAWHSTWCPECLGRDGDHAGDCWRGPEREPDDDTPDEDC